MKWLNLIYLGFSPVFLTDAIDCDINNFLNQCIEKYQKINILKNRSGHSSENTETHVIREHKICLIKIIHNKGLDELVPWCLSVGRWDWTELNAGKGYLCSQISCTCFIWSSCVIVRKKLILMQRTKRAAKICKRINHNYLYHNYHQYSFAQTIKHISHFFSSDLKVNTTIAVSLCI